MDMHHFFVVGVSYKTANIDLRGKFSINDTQHHALFLEAQKQKIKDLIVVNTCNRTELYAWVPDSKILINLLCDHSDGNKKSFEQIGYILKGEDGINHVFRVGTGLESQILGDFEIIGQIKQSFFRSKKNGTSRGLFGAFYKRCYKC